MHTIDKIFELISRYNEMFDQAVESSLSEAETVLNNDPECQQGRYGVYGIVYEDDLIYVGKSDNVKRRIITDFLGTGSHTLKRKMIETDEYDRVTRDGNFKYLLVDSNIDAMLMEGFLIKKHEDEIEFNDEIENP
ncbi:MAG TPA: GIY-YIG nuclease family protein [Candidatus Lokiarchaeia archaeon]|nr:GIY-YIG nuclease family protein [Candidatus Lokiarchaeia archaeon]